MNWRTVLKRGRRKMEQEIVVEYENDGEASHFLNFGSKAMPDLRINYTGIPLPERGGTANRLLCASALYCYASTLAAAMTARGVKNLRLKGKAVSETGKDEFQRTKINKIIIEVTVSLEDKYLPVLEKCKKIMEKGCFLTSSLENGMTVEHSIRNSEDRG
jgi:organic hydroperoxide reductase OsmC/OhrA